MYRSFVVWQICYLTLYDWVVCVYVCVHGGGVCVNFHLSIHVDVSLCAMVHMENLYSAYPHVAIRSCLQLLCERTLFYNYVFVPHACAVVCVRDQLILGVSGRSKIEHRQG